MYLLSEVFRHACAATSWMSQSSSESISVVLLDLVCMFQEINKGLSTKKQKAMLKIQREAILNDSALYISDVECRDMVFKKLEAEISWNWFLLKLRLIVLKQKNSYIFFCLSIHCTKGLLSWYWNKCAYKCQMFKDIFGLANFAGKLSQSSNNFWCIIHVYWIPSENHK